MAVSPKLQGLLLFLSPIPAGFRPNLLPYFCAAMIVPSERKAAEIADNFLDAELDSDVEAKAWLVEKIVAALEDVAGSHGKPGVRRRRRSASDPALSSNETLLGPFSIQGLGLV